MVLSIGNEKDFNTFSIESCSFLFCSGGVFPERRLPFDLTEIKQVALPTAQVVSLKASGQSKQDLATTKSE